MAPTSKSQRHPDFTLTIPPTDEDDWVSSRSSSPNGPQQIQRRRPQKRHSARPSSMHSLSGPLLRPHPLIRGTSHTPAAALAPLTITPDSPVAHLSASPPLSTSTSHPQSHLTSSPPSSPLPRRTSISSTRSVATLPVTTPDRPRTRTISTSTTALSALAQHHSLAPTRVSHFPPTPIAPESVHPLLPHPFFTVHMTMLAHRTPLRDSYDRVIRAKLGPRS